MPGVWLDGGIPDAWAALTAYSSGDIISGDGSVWVCEADGISGAIEPVWDFPNPYSPDGTVEWGSLTVWDDGEWSNGDNIQPTTPNGHIYFAQNDMDSGALEPTWPTDGGTVEDGDEVETGGGAGDDPTEVRMYFDVWDAADLQGDCVGTLTELESASIRVVDNGMGSGSFEINRHSSEFVALCSTDNLIRVRLDPDGPFDYDDDRYKFAFFIEEGDDTILSSDEEGGETVRIVGRGIEAYLSRAVIDYQAHHPFNLLSGREFDQTTRQDGQWHILETAFALPSIGTPGSVMRIFLRDADEQVPNPIPLCSSYPTGHDFNVDHDSNGTLWAAGATDWAFDVGTDLLTVLGILVNGGLYYKQFPSLLLQAYEDQPGEDLSGDISFVQGVNVATAGTRQIHATPAKSRVLYRGANAAGMFTYRWTNEDGGSATHDGLTPGAVESAIGVRQGYAEYGATPTASRLDRAGSKLVTALKNQHDGPPIIGVLNAEGSVALVDYQPGDTVALDIPEYNGNFRVHAITLTMVENGSVDPVLEFNEDAIADFSNPIAETKSGCCGCSDDILGQYLVGAVGATLVGDGGAEVEFIDPADGVTVLPYIPGTALVLVGTSPAETWVPTESDPEHGLVEVSGASGEARVVARVACDPLGDPPT